MFVPHRKHVIFTTCYGDSFASLYIDYVRTSQETHLWVPMAYYGDSFTFLYVDFVRTSQKTYLRASVTCYGYTFS
jgi:hypothetical protein